MSLIVVGPPGAGCEEEARALGRHKFIIGLEPNLVALEQETAIEVLDLSAGEATWVLLRVPADCSNGVKACFRGVCHVYETEEEARRVWRIFGR